MRRRAILLAVSGLVAAACGSSVSTDDTVPTEPTAGEPAATEPADTEPADTGPAAETTTTDPPGPTAAASLEEVRAATIRIVGTGTFADPAGGVQANVPGSGSGFVIDPSGIAVTNNHVVTGAAVLEVYLDGDDRPHNAQVLGVSECSDLAVIQIDGDDFDYLDFYDGEVTAGMQIYAAGFPLGDSEYTVLDGIVSKESADGESSWASVDAVIEHSADTLPGNSGGPIVTADGRVVAVNYAGNDAGQSFAIGLAVAGPIIETLRSGTDVGAIGINGEAFTDGANSGIFVYSVESGSPADVAGIRAGDLLLSMESIVLAVDGTMADYCDVLRSHRPDDVLGIEVLRPDTGEFFEGQLNGRPLELITSLEADLPPAVEPVDPGVVYTDYTTITDSSGAITVSVPVQWTDVRPMTWDTDVMTGTYETVGPALGASPDYDAWIDRWDVPGTFIGASPFVNLTVEELIDTYWFGDECTYDGRFDYDDGLYTGRYDRYSNCAGLGTIFFQIVAQPADLSWIATVQIVAVTDADLDAAAQIVETFQIGALGG